MKDVMYWKKELPRFRNNAFINGIKRTGDYTATPKIPYRLGGAVWSASQIATNLVPINGFLDVFDFSDIFEDMAVNHSDGPGDTIWMHPRQYTIWSELLLPYKGMFGGGDNTLDMTTNVKSAFGSVSQNGIKTDNEWPVSKVLLTSRADHRWGNFVNMDWTYVERKAEHLGAFQQSWTMGGDFYYVNLNQSHQRLLTGLDSRKANTAARTAFM